MPGADVGPAAGNRHHRRARGLFHHRIVDRDRFRRSEGAAVERHEAEVAAGLGDGVADRLHALGIDVAVFIQQNRSAEHEVAAVPEIAGLDIVGGRGRIRLLDEFCHRPDISGNHLARIDITILGGGAFGRHAESHDASRICRYQSLPAGRDKRLGIAHHVIGGERQHHRFIAAHLRKGCAGRNRRAGIPPHRLQQHIGLMPDLGQLLQHHEAIGGVGDDDRTLEQRRIRHPQDGVLKGRARPEQRQELLRTDLARGRPQPCPGAAAHDQGDNSSVHLASHTL